jgi:hypothetical protein
MTMTRLIVCCAAIALGWTVSARSEESLAEIARKEKERRERQKTGSVKEFTNSDLKVHEEEGEETPEPSSTSSSASSSSGAGSAGSSDSNEETWRARAGAARAAVAAAKKRLSALEEEYAQIGTKRLGSTDTMEILALQEKERQLQEDIEKAREDVTTQEERLQELEDEARKQQIPPGWLRE